MTSTSTDLKAGQWFHYVTNKNEYHRIIEILQPNSLRSDSVYVVICYLPNSQATTYRIYESWIRTRLVPITDEAEMIMLALRLPLLDERLGYIS